MYRFPINGLLILSRDGNTEIGYSLTLALKGKRVKEMNTIGDILATRVRIKLGFNVSFHALLYHH